MKKTFTLLLFLGTVIAVPADQPQVSYEVSGNTASATVTLIYIIPEKPHYEKIIIKGTESWVSL
jgi:hypothetical protein